MWDGVVKKFIVAAAAAAVSTVDAASAADLSVKAPIVKASVAAPGYNWTGLYVGGMGTYGWSNSQHCQIGAGPSNCDPGFPQTKMTGWQGGFTAGYDWQLAHWILGVEGDRSWGKLDGSSVRSATFACGQTCNTWISSIGTVRGRVGYAFDRFLPYLTAGVAFSDLHGAIGFVGARSTGFMTKTDFVWGAGLEYAFWQNFSAKIEYLNITKLGDFIYDSLPACGPLTPCYVHVGGNDLVRLGLNYRF